MSVRLNAHMFKIMHVLIKVGIPTYAMYAMYTNCQTLHSAI